jgi:hypothetical protein
MHAETQIEKAQNFRKRLCRDVIHQGANHGMGGAIIFKVIILTNQSIYVTIRKWIIGEKTLMIVMESSLIYVEERASERSEGGSEDFRKRQEDTIDSSVGGPKSRYIGSWDSKSGRMTWQEVGNGLHEAQLDWDLVATSYFPKVHSNISNKPATWQTLGSQTTLSQTKKRRSFWSFTRSIDRSLWTRNFEPDQFLLSAWVYTWKEGAGVE